MLAATIAAGWLADRLIGDPACYHPVAGFGRIAQALEHRVWRLSRPVGALYALSLVGGAAGGVAFIDRALVAQRRRQAAFRAFVVWSTLGGRSLERAALALAQAVEGGHIETARALAQTLVGRDPSTLDAAELCRATVESIAENASDAVVAPLLWAALLGAPGAAAYRAANTLDAMVGYRSPHYQSFGWAAARLDDVANWPAARAASLLAIAWAPLLGGRRAAAWRAAWQDGAAHPSPNAGRVEGAFAGALSLQLGGVSRYPHGIERRPKLRPAPRRMSVTSLAACSSRVWSARPPQCSAPWSLGPSPAAR
jgi:adenosylcobinamide-phosphate synthase